MNKRVLLTISLLVGIVFSFSAKAAGPEVGSQVLYDVTGGGVSFVVSSVLDITNSGLVKTSDSERNYVRVDRLQPYRPVSVISFRGHDFRVGETVLFDINGFVRSFRTSQILDISQNGFVKTSESERAYIQIDRIQPYVSRQVMNFRGMEYRVGATALFDITGFGRLYRPSTILDVTESGFVKTSETDGYYFGTDRIKPVQN